MVKRRNRIYIDTSVFGGVYDDIFSESSRRLFMEAETGKHLVLLSDVTAGELRDAPAYVREFVAALSDEAVEALEFTQEMAELRDAYLEARIVAAKWADDAAHVAAATVARADVIVSWNFRHIVKWEKIRAFNAVNLSLGYPVMTILSPREVVSDEEDS